MFLRLLEVRDFRSVRQAHLTFGRGLNVLFGPNELGKSTLAEALRAAFLLPCGSSVGKEFVPWGTDLVPRVVVEFETQQADVTAETAEPPSISRTVWRITKTFNDG